MARALSTFAAGLMTVSTLALGVGGAEAQTSFIVDRLISGSADTIPLRGIDTETRPAKRYAVVVGNADYSAIPDLANAIADADAISSYLRQHGYLVNQYENLTKRGFEDMLRRVLFDVDKDTEVVVFFAGHGFQIGADNYLVPVDADLDSVYDVPFEAVSLGSLVGIVGARARLQVVILDSCRDNPFAGKEVLTQVGNTLRETRTGFSSQAAPLNSMLVYSTSPGALAYDGNAGDTNSPFTASLIEEASESPDELVKDLFEGVRLRTVNRTNGRQVPWESSTLVEPVSFGLSGQLSRPISVSSSGVGASRGVARVVDDAPEAVLQVAQQVGATTVVEADFVPEVDIGGALVDALNLQPGDRIAFTGSPETGHLMREDLTGLRREVTGQTLDTAAVAELILVNQSVQIPARTLSNGTITDTFDIEVNGVAQKVALNLVPDQCDFEAGDHLDPDGMGLTRYPNEIRPELALAACLQAVERAPEVGRFHSQLGRAYLALRENEKAEAAFEKARELGHARAWQELGLLARYAERGIGNSSQPDSDAVRQLFARGVAEGDPYAMHTLGYELLTNGGTTEAEIEGYDLMVRAMEVGHTFAMNALTGIYLDESSEYHDPERALRYMRESVAREDIYGMDNLGEAYAQGRAGLEVDMGEALELLKAAAEGGHPTSPRTLALIYRDGASPAGRNAQEAVRWFMEGTERGDGFAAANAAYMLLTEEVAGFDRFDAALVAAKGAALNSPTSQGAADQLAYTGDADRNGGAQRLLNETAEFVTLSDGRSLLEAMGGPLTVDGNWDDGSQRMMDAVLSETGLGAAETDPQARLLQIAQAYWLANPLRVDLY